MWMKKGFTLVELLVVIVIIGMLSLVAYPSVIKIINDSREEAYRNQIRVVEKITKEWAVSNPTIVPAINESGSTCSCIPKCIKVDDLKNSGYLSGDDIKNPKGGVLSGGVEITCSCRTGSSCNTCKYEYKYKPSC